MKTNTVDKIAVGNVAAAILGLAFVSIGSSAEATEIDKGNNFFNDKVLESLPDLGGGGGKAPQAIDKKNKIPTADASGTVITPSEQSVGGVIVEVCPQGIASPSFERDCKPLLDAASQGDPGAANALNSVTPAAASVPSSASLNHTETAKTAIAGRLTALRQGVSGFSLNLAGPDLQRGGAAGDSDFGKLGGFLTGGYGRSSYDQTLIEPGYDSNNWNVNAGLDYKLSDRFTLGGVISYARANPKFDDNRGNLDSDSFSLLAYGNYFFNDTTYIDGILGYGWNSYDQNRRIQYALPSQGVIVDQNAHSNFDGGQTLVAIGLGMDLHSGGLTYGPVARLQYVNLDVDGYSETMSNPNAAGSGWAVRIDDQTFRSTTFSLGGNLSYSSSQSWGVLLPHVNLSWIHEFENDGKVVPGSFVGDPSGTPFFITTAKPDSDYFNLGVGLSAVFQGGSSAFIGVDALLGYENLSSYQVTIGYRTEF